MRINGVRASSRRFLLPNQEKHIIFATKSNQREYYYGKNQDNRSVDIGR